MNITVNTEKPESGQLIATLTIAKKDVDAAIKKTYREIARKYAFQGFRRGRAPRPVIDGIVGREAVLADATNSLLVEAEPLMLEQLDIVPLGQIDYGENPDLAQEKSDYTIEAKIAVRPDVELDSYDAPAIEMPPEEATEAEIDRQLDMLLSYRTTFEDVEEDRGAEEADIILADVESINNLREYEGENRMFSLSDLSLHEEWRQALLGMKKGEEKEVRWTIDGVPKEDGETPEILFAAKVKVNAIRQTVTPELTEENVQDDFGFETIAELRDAVKEEIEEDKSRSLPRLKEDRVVEAIGAHLTLEEVPEAYGEQVFQELANQFLTQLQGQGMSLDAYLKANGSTSDDFVKGLREQADERARQSLALDALADHLGFEATDEDLREEFEKAGVPDVDAAMKEFYSEGRMPAVRESIRRTKAVNWLVENAEVTVVDEIARSAEEADDNE
ncbi:MAG: trigger factor [Atopobiaceae bacterium]|nr:trigger factor [Atopobiaceae bacterium]